MCVPGLFKATVESYAAAHNHRHRNVSDLISIGECHGRTARHCVDWAATADTGMPSLSLLSWVPTTLARCRWRMNLPRTPSAPVRKINPSRCPPAHIRHSVRPCRPGAAHRSGAAPRLGQRQRDRGLLRTEGGKHGCRVTGPGAELAWPTWKASSPATTDVAEGSGWLARRGGYFRSRLAFAVARLCHGFSNALADGLRPRDSSAAASVIAAAFSRTMRWYSAGEHVFCAIMAVRRRTVSHDAAVSSAIMARALGRRFLIGAA